MDIGSWKRGIEVKRVADVQVKVDVARSETILQQPAEVQRSNAQKWRMRLQSGWPFIAIMVLAALLRFIGLGNRPLHHDESLHAYFSLQLMHNLEQWQGCLGKITCYHYDPLLHGPFQFHAIALVYKISQMLGAPDHGVNTTTVRIVAALLGTLLVSFPYFIRDYLGGRLNAWVACFLLATSPSMVYFSRFAREDISMACFTLLLVIATGRYVRDRKWYWLVLAGMGFTLSYATKEATFLTAAVFGSFLVMAIVWELGVKVRMPECYQLRLGRGKFAVRKFPRTGAPVALLVLGLISLPFAQWFFGFIKDLSNYINVNASTSTTYVDTVKDQTAAVLPWLAAAVGLWAAVMIIRDVRRGRGRGKQSSEQPRRMRGDFASQPLLTMLRNTPWVHWFVALVVSAFIFVLLFSVVFTNLHHGITDGIWQGIYYWLQQQQVARGGQPWYYYFLLIPFYEQVGIVFSFIGIIRSVRRPTRFRLFVIYWMVGNLTLYSWAGEKMPWLIIHITMPMLLLAALGLEPVIRRCIVLVAKKEQKPAIRIRNKVQYKRQKPTRTPSKGITIAVAAATIFLFVLTLQNMFQVTFVHYADGPHEMMIYVQTTTDVDVVMAKIDALDQSLHQGKHTISIGVMADAEWPFYWYLRDYTNVCYGFPTGCSDANPAVILSGGDNISQTQAQYSANASSGKNTDYVFQRYHLRSWWDEGYKPAPCVPSTTNSCQGQPTWGGVGPLLWLSYGDTPPAQAQFNPFLAARNVWNWWWSRTPIGSTGGATDMGLLIRSDLVHKP